MCSRADDPAYLSMQEADMSAPLNRDGERKVAATVQVFDRLAEDVAREKAWADAVREQSEIHAEWRERVAWQSELFLLIAECLIPLAFPASPDGGARGARLQALAAKLRETP